MLLALGANAHDTWIAPEQGQVSRGDVARLDLTSGMTFPSLDYAIQPERVERALVHCGTTEHQMRIGQRASHSLQLEARCDGDSIATIAVDLKPKELELTPAQVDEYLEEIGQTAEIKPIWLTMPAPRRWREVYRKHAKTFVRFGTAAGTSWKTPVGSRLEIVPRTDPTARHAGDQLAIQLLSEGRPLAGFAVAIASPAGKRSVVRTDDHGVATVLLPRAGPYLLSVTRLRRSEQAEVEWQSDFATMTVEAAR